MGLELKLNLRLSQQLVMTPQLQQAIKLLQLSRMELVDAVQAEMIENPVLEEVPESTSPQASLDELQTKQKSQEENKEMFDQVGSAEWEQYLGNYSPGPGVMRDAGDELPSYEATLTKKDDLTDHLLWQLRMGDFGQDEQAVAALIIGALDDRGFVTEPIEDIARREGIDLGFAEKVLGRIQEFDPIGVAARNLQECLLIQSRHFYGQDDTLEAIISNHMSNLERKNYPAIAKEVGITLDAVYEAARLIGELEPKPGRPFGGESTHYITPDIYVYKISGDFVIVLNDDGLPKLKVSSFYQGVLSQGVKGQTKEYVQDKLKKAVWLIKSIQQRQRTIYKVTESIVKFQRDFFDKGVGALKPMVLRDVAEDIGMHESTISRVTSNKYMHCPQGIYELKYFFNSGINRTDGDALASEAVKNKIKALIGGEDARRPLSDQRIVELLRDQNIDIARRTVAKYREMLGILSSSKRKKLL